MAVPKQETKSAPYQFPHSGTAARNRAKPSPVTRRVDQGFKPRPHSGAVGRWPSLVSDTKQPYPLSVRGHYRRQSTVVIDVIIVIVPNGSFSTSAPPEWHGVAPIRGVPTELEAFGPKFAGSIVRTLCGANSCISTDTVQTDTLYRDLAYTTHSLTLHTDGAFLSEPPRLHVNKTRWVSVMFWFHVILVAARILIVGSLSRIE